MLDAGGLTACHRVAGDELHALRTHGLHRLHKAGLDAGDVGKDAAGLDEMAVGLEPVDEGRGVEAKDDVVGLRDEVLEIVGLSAGDIAVALAAVDAVHMEPGFGKLEGVFAAQQSEAHDQITLCFIQHILPPRLTA